MLYRVASGVATAAGAGAVLQRARQHPGAGRAGPPWPSGGGSIARLLAGPAAVRGAPRPLVAPPAAFGALAGGPPRRRGCCCVA